MSILPVPLHPLIVHLPIALTVLVPLFAVGTLWAVKRGAPPRRTWGITVALLAVLLGSGQLAKETGEDEEEAVEQVVGDAALETHEEAADVFMAVTGAVLLVAAAGLAGGQIGTVARVVATAGTVALVVVGYNVGHSGGALVYEHGAASAYSAGATGAGSGRPGVSASDDDR